MRGRIAGLAFAALAVGLAGLLLNEFVLHLGAEVTLASAAVEVLGFILLVLAHRRAGRGQS